MFIYDRFPSLAQAQAFADEVSDELGLTTQLYTDAGAAQASDPTIAELDPPIVHVERDDDADEAVIERLALNHGGRYVGT